MSNEECIEALAGRGRFATTRWSLVTTAAGDDLTRSEHALAELCEQYWMPLYAYVRRRGHDVDDARDLTQAFFAKLLEKQDLRVADPARGRFRTFLLTAMKNFLTGEWRKEMARKRGGDVEILSLDFREAESSYRLEPAHNLHPEALFERRWALGMLERAVDDLRAPYARAGNLEIFDALKGFVGAEAETVPYAELAARLGRSEGALRTAVSRLRARWRTRLRALVAETVSHEGEVRDELGQLLHAVAPPP